MKHFIMVPFVAAALAGAAQAQNALTPTDVVEFGEVAGTFKIRAFSGTTGQSDSTGGFDIDAETNSFDALLEAAVGLGYGFQAQVSIPYLLTQTTEGDGDIGGAVDFESTSAGIGDLMFGGTYRIFKDSRALPQFIVGVDLVLPSGDPDDAVAEVEGAITQDGEDGGAGDGALQYALRAGLSKDFGVAEPYVLLRYLIAGEGEPADDETVDLADVFTVMLGSEFAVAKTIGIDVRLTFDFNGEEVTEDDTFMVEEVEEAHFILGGQVSGYFELGHGVTLVAGLGFKSEEDHEVNDLTQIDSEDAFAYGFELGVHVRLGVGK